MGDLHRCLRELCLTELCLTLIITSEIMKLI